MIFIEHQILMILDRSSLIIVGLWPKVHDSSPCLSICLFSRFSSRAVTTQNSRARVYPTDCLNASYPCGSVWGDWPHTGFLCHQTMGKIIWSIHGRNVCSPDFSIKAMRNCSSKMDWHPTGMPSQRRFQAFWWKIPQAGPMGPWAGHGGAKLGPWAEPHLHHPNVMFKGPMGHRKPQVEIKCGKTRNEEVAAWVNSWIELLLSLFQKGASEFIAI